MQFTPHEYQRRAIDWVVRHPRCLLLLEMGLGKTAICLSAVERLIEYGEVSRVLVIAPKKVAESTWSDEAARWDHLDLRVSNVIGDLKHRTAAVAEDADIYVIGRDSVVWLTEYLGDSWDFDMVIIDELTSFKNHRSLRFKALKRVLPKVIRIVGLTGTPSPNGLIDLWAQVYCIDQGERLGKYFTHYRDEYFNNVMRNNIVIISRLKPGSNEKIMDAISDITLAMRSEDWLQLPPMTETDIPVSLDDSLMKKYKDFERSKVMAIADSDKPLTADSAAACINKLAQFANGAIYDEQKNVIHLHDEKLARLKEIFLSENTPLLVFYQFKHDKDRIIQYFKECERRAWDSEGPWHPDIRAYSGYRDMWDWNKGIIPMLLCHPASAAFGLNMQQGGSRIVWFSTGWNLEHYQQANARLYRQGQKNPVRVFRLIAKGTVDERMAAAIVSKGDVQRDVVKTLVGSMIDDHKRMITSK